MSYQQEIIEGTTLFFGRLVYRRWPWQLEPKCTNRQVRSRYNINLAYT